MTDEQLQRKQVIKRILLLSALLFLVSLGFFYYRFATQSAVDAYKADIARAETLQAQVDSLTQTNSDLLATIDQNGKQLVSFTDDKIKYINLASTLSLDNEVRINKLSVSDVWTMGQMSGMTTSIEIEGGLDNVQKFISSYCSTEYTNRINVISCRPSERYPWVSRDIDGEKVLTWFDLSEETALYEAKEQQNWQEEQSALMEAGIPADLTRDTDKKEPITLEKMFAPMNMKVYLEIDFLGRE